MGDDPDAQAPGQAPFLSDGDRYLWTFTPLVGPTVPLGIADAPAPDGLVGVHSHDVGNSTLAQLGGDASKASATVYEAVSLTKKLAALLDKLPTP